MKKIKIVIMVMMASIAMTLPKQSIGQIKSITGIISDNNDGSLLTGVNVVIKGTTKGTVSDMSGKYQIDASKGDVLLYSYVGYVSESIQVGDQSVINVHMEADVSKLDEIVVTGYATQIKKSYAASVAVVDGKRRFRDKRAEKYRSSAPNHVYAEDVSISHNTEEYEGIEENTFLEPTKNPLSTFSIDVDAASYSNVRRFLNQGQRPPKDAVRIEEMVNYFNYDYVEPDGEDPFSITTEIGVSPWNEKHQLVHIGLQGKNIATDDLPASNLVFLIDVSGSMNAYSKLGLLKSSFKMLTKQLRPQDRVAMVVYAGAAGVVLPSTPGNEKETIIKALDNLRAGGSTAGGEGIELAYSIAKKHFVENGNNRVILATDGDFNVGASSNGEMERLIEEKRNDDIFLTVLGFGMGNYKDSKMETLADKGNGNYAYIDTMEEARKVLVSEFGGTLFTIAKDVKLQIEFNPAKVQAYRLIGYENRKLNKEDFNNDKKDAGDLGAGHTVTAMYEIIPVGVESSFIQSVDDLKYQKTKEIKHAVKSDDIMTMKLRYKQPKGTISKLIAQTLKGEAKPVENTSDNFRFAAAVAAYGMILRDSEFKGDVDLNKVIALAKGSKGGDEEGYRSEFIRLVKSTDFLASR